MRVRGLVGIALAVLAATTTRAETMIYRCGPEGRVYSDLPCAGGRALDLIRDPGHDRVSEAAEVARRERILADTLAAQRRSRARSPAGVIPAAIRHPRGDPGTPHRRMEVAGEPGAEHKRRRRKPGGADGAPADPRVTFQVTLPAGPVPKASRRAAPRGQPRQPG